MSTQTASAFEAERMNIAVEAPKLSRALVALEREIRIDPVLRELVKLRASILNGCAYCIDLHTKDARKAGESEQRLYAVAAWHEAPFLNQRERAALALTDAVTLVADTHVPAEVYEQAAREFDPEELATCSGRSPPSTPGTGSPSRPGRRSATTSPPARRPHPRVRIPRRGMKNRLSASPRAEADAS